MTAIRFEVWTRPESATFERKFPLTGVESYGLDFGPFGRGEIRIPSNHPRLDEIMFIDLATPANSVGTLIRAYVGSIWVHDFYASRVAIDYGDVGQRLATITGGGLGMALERTRLRQQDWAADAQDSIVVPDWEYGVGSNLLRNPGFEDGIPSYTFEDGVMYGFTDNKDAAGYVGLVNGPETSMAEAESGLWSMLFDAPTTVHESGVISASINCVPGGQVTVDSKFLSNTSSKRFTAYITVEDGFVDNSVNGDVRNGKVYVELDSAAQGAGATDGTWQDFAIDVNMGDEQTSFQIGFDADDPGSAPIAYVDTVVFAGAGIGTSPWVAFSPSLGYEKFEVSTGQVRTGTYSLLWTGDDPGIVNQTHVEDTTVVPVPTGGASGNRMVLMASKNNATAWGALTGWTLDYQAQQGLGDPRAIVGYSRAWGSEPADYTLPATADHAVMVITRGMTSFRGATSTDHQSVVADFDSPSVTSDPGDMVFRWAYGEQQIDFDGIAANNIVDGHKITNPGPSSADTGSEEIYVHVAPTGSATGVFTWDYNDSGAPEIFAITAVYNSTSGTRGGSIGPYQPVSGLEVGAPYTLGFWVWNDGDRDRIYSAVLKFPNAGFEASNDVAVPPGVWTWVAVHKPAITASDLWASLRSQDVPTGIDTYTDDASLTKGNEAAPLGEILIEMIDDAATDHAADNRTALAWLTIDFTATVDSDGVAWDEDVSLRFKRGTDYRAIVEQFTPLGYEFDMRPDPADDTDIRLEAYNPDGLGSDLTTGDGGAIVDGFVSFGPLIRREPRETYVMTEGEDLVWADTRDTALEGVWGEIENYTGSKDNLVTDLAKIGTAQLNSFPLQEFRVSLQGPTLTPSIDYRIGDIVRVTPGVIPTAKYRVVGITVAGDELEPVWQVSLEAQ